MSEAEQPAMHRIVRELSARAEQPMPRLFVSPTLAPNAFPTGRDPQHAAVCATEGILELLDERELRGVLGHELMHVDNRDMLTGSLAAAMSSVITYLAYAAMFFGGGNDRERGSGIGGLVMLILGPIAAGLVEMAISRTREYDADAPDQALTHARRVNPVERAPWSAPSRSVQIECRWRTLTSPGTSLRQEEGACPSASCSARGASRTWSRRRAVISS